MKLQHRAPLVRVGARRQLLFAAFERNFRLRAKLCEGRVMSYRLRTCSTLVASVALAAACGGGDGSVTADAGTGILNLGVTDAPVDAAVKVVVEFSGVELKP